MKIFSVTSLERDQKRRVGIKRKNEDNESIVHVKVPKISRHNNTVESNKENIEIDNGAASDLLVKSCKISDIKDSIKK